MESKTGIKTVDKLSEIPVLNSAVTTASDYYGKVKEANSLIRTSCNLAELSLKTFKYAASPITYLCKKPIESVDSYLSDKVDQIENTYPSITKPTDQFTANAMETLNNMKDKTVTDLKTYGTNKVHAAIRVGTDSIAKSAELVDSCLEHRFAKMLTDPVLDFTEKSLDYILPPVTYAEIVSEGETIIDEETAFNPTTIRRIYNINKRIYATTFKQLSQLHFQFESTIERLKALRSFFESFYSQSKNKISSVVDTMSKTTLAAQCADYIQKHNISLNRLEQLSKAYFKAIMADVNQILDNYMKLVKNFPLVFNGTKLKQTIENFGEKMNMESFSTNMKVTIDYLKTINEALVSYTKQMFQVVIDSKFLQSIKRMTTQELQNMFNNKKTTTTVTVTAAQSPVKSDFKITANKSVKPLQFVINESIEEEDLNKLDTNKSLEVEEEETDKQNSTNSNEETFDDEDDEVSTEVNKSINDMTQQIESNLSSQSQSNESESESSFN